MLQKQRGYVGVKMNLHTEKHCMFKYTKYGLNVNVKKIHLAKVGLRIT